MSIDYAAAGELLEAYGRAWATFNGDAWVALFTDDAVYDGDPFSAPMVGHNALREFLLTSAQEQTDVDFTVERHWVSGGTVLASFHAGYVQRIDHAHVRFAGFLTAEVASDGRVEHFREWWMAAPATAPSAG
jgi:SnoaL-like domain